MALFGNDLTDLLEAQGFVDGAAAAPTWYFALEQPAPDFAVTVLPEQGPAPRRTIGEQPLFAVRVRHPDGREANLFLRQVFEFLQEFQGRIGAAPVYPVARIFATTTAAQLGLDENGQQGRWRVTQTYTAILRQVF